MLPHKNPLIYRHFCLLRRPANLFGVAAVILGLAGLVYAAFRASLEQGGFNSAEEMHLRFAQIIMAGQVLLLVFLALAKTMEVIPSERSRTTDVFLVTLPISPADKTVGLCVGPNLGLIWPVLLLVPIVVLSLLSAGVPVANILWFYALLAGAFCTFTLAGLAVGSGLGGGSWHWIISGMVLLLSVMVSGGVMDEEFNLAPVLPAVPFAFVGLLTSVSVRANHILLTGGCGFYDYGVPWQLCPAAFYVFFIVFFFIVCRRRLAHPEPRPVCRITNLVAMSVFLFLLVGFLSDYWTSKGHDWAAIVQPYFVVSFFVVLAWGIFSGVRNNHAIDWLGEHESPVKSLFTRSLSDFRTLPVIHLILAWAIIVFMGAAGVWIYNGVHLPGRWLLGSAVLLMFLLGYTAVAWSVSASIASGAGLIIALLAVLGLILVPSMFHGVTENLVFLEMTPMACFERSGLMRGRYPRGACSLTALMFPAIVFVAGMLTYGLTMCRLSRKLRRGAGAAAA